MPLLGRALLPLLTLLPLGGCVVATEVPVARYGYAGPQPYAYVAPPAYRPYYYRPYGWRRW